jgi:hypothetical protein
MRTPRRASLLVLAVASCLPAVARSTVDLYFPNAVCQAFEKYDYHGAYGSPDLCAGLSLSMTLTTRPSSVLQLLPMVSGSTQHTRIRYRL